MPGRCSHAADLHPERSCGPCGICGVNALDGKYTHNTSISNWQQLITAPWATNRYPHAQNLQGHACICWPCKKSLTRSSSSSTTTNSNTNSSSSSSSSVDTPPVRHLQCSVADCDADAITHYPPTQTDSLPLQDGQDMKDAVVCSKHYSQLTSGRKHHCGDCHAPMELEPLRKAANYQVVAAKLKDEGITVSEDAVYCTKCYKAHLALVTVDGYASTDYQLNAIVIAQRGIHTALAATLVLAGEQLLSKSAVLLVTLHDHFMHHAATGSHKPAKWLLSRKMEVLAEHIEVVYPNVKKRGILLLRRGCNTQQALHDALSAQRCAAMSHDKLATDIPVVNNRTESENGVSAMAEQVHMMIRAQAGDFIGKEFEDGTALNKLNFDKVIQSVHPHLWSWIWVVLYGEGTQIPNPNGNAT